MIEGYLNEGFEKDVDNLWKIKQFWFINKYIANGRSIIEWFPIESSLGSAICYQC